MMIQSFFFSPLIMKAYIEKTPGPGIMKIEDPKKNWNEHIC